MGDYLVPMPLFLIVTWAELIRFEGEKNKRTIGLGQLLRLVSIVNFIPSQ